MSFSSRAALVRTTRAARRMAVASLAAVLTVAGLGAAGRSVSPSSLAWSICCSTSRATNT
jgi:hypothetical protein